MSFKTLSILLLFFITSCKEDIYDLVDISNITLDNKVSILLPSENGLFSKEALKNTDSVFVDLYINQVLGIASMNDTDRDIDLNEIFVEDWVKELNDSIKLEYAKLDDILKEFDIALRHLKYYFPSKPTPNIYFCNTLFNYQRFLFEDSQGDAIGIGLDMFLKDYYDYKMIDPQNPAYSDYLTIHFDRHHIVPKSIQLLVDEIVVRPNGSRFIDQMVHNGKKIYILEHLMPKTSKHIILDYTPDQYQWCEDNEFEIWSFFNSEKLIYETSPAKISKYLNESPTSPGMPAESPGRTANYLGWKVVSKWMKQTNASMDQLINNLDAQSILDQARYKPKRK